MGEFAASNPCHHGGISSTRLSAAPQFGEGLADHLAGAFLGKP